MNSGDKEFYFEVLDDYLYARGQHGSDEEGLQELLALGLSREDATAILGEWTVQMLRVVPEWFIERETLNGGR